MPYDHHPNIADQNIPMSNSNAVIRWHTENGGHNNGRLAGHALRLLNEAVELCVACGASADEIGARVASEIAKAAGRKEFGHSVIDYDEVREELVDVQFLSEVLAHHTGDVDLCIERDKKLDVLWERKWRVDRDGCLWREAPIPPGVDRIP